jgi:hypothetical protein
MYIHNLPNAHVKFRLPGPNDSLVKTTAPNAKEFFAQPPYFNFTCYKAAYFFQGLFPYIISYPKSKWR